MEITFPGKTALVTGANTGLGLETARMLALKGATVVLACRNLDKGKAALARIQSEQPKGTASLAALDLSDLDSVAAFAADFSATSAQPGAADLDRAAGAICREKYGATVAAVATTAAGTAETDARPTVAAIAAIAAIADAAAAAAANTARAAIGLQGCATEKNAAAWSVGIQRDGTAAAANSAGTTAGAGGIAAVTGATSAAPATLTSARRQL